MTGTVADFTPEPDAEAMLNLDRAHKGYEKVRDEVEAALKEAHRKVYEQYNPILFEAQSVLYEAMAKAAKAGFSYPDMMLTMGCAAH